MSIAPGATHQSPLSPLHLANWVTVRVALRFHDFTFHMRGLPVARISSECDIDGCSARVKFPIVGCLIKFPLFLFRFAWHAIHSAFRSSSCACIIASMSPLSIFAGRRGLNLTKGAKKCGGGASGTLGGGVGGTETDLYRDFFGVPSSACTGVRT